MDKKIFLEQLIEIIPDVKIIEDLPDNPILKFELSSKMFSIYTVENYIKRTKFCREYNTFFEISPIDTSEIEVLKKNSFELFKCNFCFSNNKLIFNISKMIHLDNLLAYIANYKKHPLLN